jgi:hypothetical protein
MRKSISRKNKKSWSLTWLGLLLTISGLTLHAQEFSMKTVELAGEKLILHYDLSDSVKNRFYTITLYSSKDNFLNPLEKVTGDIGIEVKPGANNKIIWSAKDELGASFQGGVSLEIRGKVYIPFVRLTGFEDYKSVKRGKPIVVTWSGGTRQNILNFELYKGDEKIWVQPSVANTGNYELKIPTNVKPGHGYRFRISDSKNKDEVVFTTPFTIKRKVPLGLKVLPVAAVGTVIYLLLGKSADNAIPDPLTPSDKDKN